MKRTTKAYFRKEGNRLVERNLTTHRLALVFPRRKSSHKGKKKQQWKTVTLKFGCKWFMRKILEVEKI